MPEGEGSFRLTIRGEADDSQLVLQLVPDEPVIDDGYLAILSRELLQRGENARDLTHGQKLLGVLELRLTETCELDPEARHG